MKLRNPSMKIVKVISLMVGFMITLRLIMFMGIELIEPWTQFNSFAHLVILCVRFLLCNLIINKYGMIPPWKCLLIAVLVHWCCQWIEWIFDCKTIPPIVNLWLLFLLDGKSWEKIVTIGVFSWFHLRFGCDVGLLVCIKWFGHKRWEFFCIIFKSLEQAQIEIRVSVRRPHTDQSGNTIIDLGLLRLVWV